jgi:putative ABC transport system permease protein
VASTRLAGGLVHGVSGIDPATFLGAPLVLMLVEFLSCYLPARRATKVAPMMALRQG